MQPQRRFEWCWLEFARGKSLTNNIKIRKLDSNWVVRSGGAILGESRNVLKLSEGDYPAVIYFPREDIAMAFLDRTDKTTHCPHKGDASYYTIVNKSSRNEDAVWTYETPLEAVSPIKDHLAFYASDSVKIEQI